MYSSKNSANLNQIVIINLWPHMTIFDTNYPAKNFNQHNYIFFFMTGNNEMDPRTRLGHHGFRRSPRHSSQNVSTSFNPSPVRKKNFQK